MFAYQYIPAPATNLPLSTNETTGNPLTTGYNSSMKSLCILGRQAGISIAELESLYGAEAVTIVNDEVALVDAEVDQARLGGTQKIARLYTVIPAQSWSELENYLTQTLPVQLADMPDRKIHFGVSLYGLHVSIKQLQKSTFAIKKALRASGKSIRVIPNKHLALSSAQVYHNHIIDENGAEIVICRARDGQIYIGKTVSVQDIDGYAGRDQNRPKRDARVGMLPPKLAQIIINLAAAHLSTSDKPPPTVLDPFCGTGVLLQEALLMRYNAYGSDLEPRMIDYSEQNLAWLDKTYGPLESTFRLQQADATTHKWLDPFDAVAAEGFLGKPLRHAPAAKEQRAITAEADDIFRQFLRNLATQTPSGFRACIAVPAWHTESGIKHLETLESLADLGYNRVSFVHVGDPELIYHRKDQVVGRELVVLTRT